MEDIITEATFVPWVTCNGVGGESHSAGASDCAELCGVWKVRM